MTEKMERDKETDGDRKKILLWRRRGQESTFCDCPV